MKFDSPLLSRSLALLAQNLSSQDKVRLIDLANGEKDLSEFPKLWAEFIEGSLLQKHAAHDQSTHGRRATGTPRGGNNLTHRDILLLGQGSDTLVKKLYNAEEKFQKTDQNEVQMPFMKGRENFDSQEEYKKAYKEYSKKWQEAYVERTRNIQSSLGEKHLNGTVKGAQNYVSETTSSDWFVEAFGDGGVIKSPTVKLVTSQSYAGKYSVGTKSGTGFSQLSLNKNYAKNEPTLVHEISHYATTISQTTGLAGHGVEFAKNHIFVASNIIGEAYASGLEAAYKAEGIDLGG